MSTLLRRVAWLSAIVAIGAACNPHPFVDPTGRLCADDDPCPAGWSCLLGECQPGSCPGAPGCSSDAGTVDSGFADAGPVDSGIPDGGAIDSGTADAGPLDAGPVDAGPADAGPTDAGHGCQSALDCPAGAHEVMACLDGGCLLSACTAPYASCGGSGCTVNLSTDPGNCGGCDAGCQIPNAVAGCAGGACTLQSCVAGFGDCDGIASNGCETPLDTNAHCGSCATSCSFANAAAACIGGACELGACDPGFANCDALTANGCETNLASSVQSCGSCGASCNLANATAVCVDGGCAIGACEAGFANCDGLATNGCEVNVDTDVLDCGRCAFVCSSDNDTPSCVGGICQFSCNQGFAHCQSGNTGCETATDGGNSVLDCGGCGISCSTLNGVPSCVGGACQWSCDPGFAHCASGNTGCETNLLTSTSSCGACGRACSNANVALLSCDGGLCDSSCLSGYGNCSEPAAPASDDGCETNTATSSSSCGSSGTACPSGESCSGGGCVPLTCDAGTSNCNGSGCSCATPACCGTACQVTHQNGLGEPFYDCTALGTYNQTQASEALKAWPTSVGATVFTTECNRSSTNPNYGVCAQTSSQCACWYYQGSLVGTVTFDSSAKNVVCPTSGDPTWN
ncbi:MAG: hypothetical protein ACYCWW_13550 [Deltaproteobacteria bacterium]